MLEALAADVLHESACTGGGTRATARLPKVMLMRVVGEFAFADM